MIIHPVNRDDYTLKVKIRWSPQNYTDSFAWLHRKIFKLNVDSREVFLTEGSNTVLFHKDHQHLAVLFAVKWGR